MNGTLVTAEARLDPWTRVLLDVLTDRERQALALHAGGTTSAEIATTFGVSVTRANALIRAAESKVTAAAERAVLLHRHVPAVVPHARDTECAAQPCKVPASMMGTLDLPVSVLDLGVRAETCMEAAGIEYVGQLVRLNQFDLLRLRNLGRKTLREIQELLGSVGLHLGMNVDGWTPPHGPARRGTP